MTAARLVPSSRSRHECDDRAERIVFMCVETLIRAMLVEQSAVAHQLAGERGAHAKVPDLERAVSS